MRRITDWPIWVFLGIGATVLGTFVDVVDNGKALAAMIPFALKSEMEARVEEVNKAWAAQFSAVQKGITQLDWNAASDRAARLKTELRNDKDLRLRLKDVLAKEFDQDRQNLLDDTEQGIADKTEELRVLNCRLKAHDADVTVC